MLTNFFKTISNQLQTPPNFAKDLRIPLEHGLASKKWRNDGGRGGVRCGQTYQERGASSWSSRVRKREGSAADFIPIS